ncbi:cell division protein FtsQ/DivIB [Desulfovibrio ferrophilus]|uniref:POTRA domain, FtsQ-type family protein n=1 Tax=Desulfovibrio ferrophilus TaxID=241368 RepID=A0A2Z6AZ47_9BACT|nr:FtsQ-type POTRA domain-containing protein [Desulfovibrio ferrophilus]BBD08541.1 POTRA domain, FtsQ-type family protein [Desulfovibrio ferrophilus]
MTMAATMRTGGLLPRSKGGNSYHGRAAGGGGRLRPGKALVWMFALVVGLGFVALLSLGLLVSFRWLTTSAYFSLSEIEVTGNRHLSTEELVTLTGTELGVNTLDMRIEDIEGRLVANPWTEQVAVRRVLPGKLSIAVTERIPAYWMRTGKGLFYAEADGSVIDAVASDRFVSLPQLEVGQGGDASLDRLVNLMADFNEAGLPIKAGQAAWVRLHADRLELYFEERDLWLSVSEKEWKRNMERLTLVWGDLERRGEAAGTREIRIFGGKVWVRT